MQDSGNAVLKNWDPVLKENKSKLPGTTHMGGLLHCLIRHGHLQVPLKWRLRNSRATRVYKKCRYKRLHILLLYWYYIEALPGGSMSPVWILKRLVSVFINACPLLSALQSLSQFGRGRLSLVAISFYALSLLFGPCHLLEFTLAGTLHFIKKLMIKIK